MPQVADLDLALITIARIVQGADRRRLPETDRADLRQRIVAGIVNLEALLAAITPRPNGVGAK